MLKLHSKIALFILVSIFIAGHLFWFFSLLYLVTKCIVFSYFFIQAYFVFKPFVFQLILINIVDGIVDFLNLFVELGELLFDVDDISVDSLSNKSDYYIENSEQTNSNAAGEGSNSGSERRKWLQLVLVLSTAIILYYLLRRYGGPGPENDGLGGDWGFPPAPDDLSKTIPPASHLLPLTPIVEGANLLGLLAAYKALELDGIILSVPHIIEQVTEFAITLANFTPTEWGEFEQVHFLERYWDIDYFRLFDPDIGPPLTSEDLIHLQTVRHNDLVQHFIEVAETPNYIRELLFRLGTFELQVYEEGIYSPQEIIAEGANVLARMLLHPLCEVEINRYFPR
jgi:hypothetical protein